MDEQQLIPTAKETWAGIKVVADAIIQRAQDKVHPSTTRQITSKTNKSGLDKQMHGHLSIIFLVHILEF